MNVLASEYKWVDLSPGPDIITVNDYLAKRDKEQMRKVYEFLGMTVGVIVHGQDPHTRREQYQCDISIWDISVIFSTLK